MLITPLSLVIAAIALAGLYFVTNRIKKDRLGIGSAMIWLALWASMAIFTLFPALLDMVLPITHLNNRVFLGIFGALVLLFAVQFGQTTRMDALLRDQARLVREMALVNYRQRYGLDNKDRRI
ncbi:MAG: DUF2304 domain-containing protein [Magnetospirillum sp.]|nr:DUF2304 domain-containing protein [Magnetospirillum sp.]